MIISISILNNNKVQNNDIIIIIIIKLINLELNFEKNKVL
jgi:hypothetical protein